MPTEPNTPQQEDPFVVEAEFTPEEFDILRELSKQLELTGVQVLRQALRCYQLIATGRSKLVEVNPIPKMQPQPPQSAARVDIDAVQELYDASTPGEWINPPTDHEVDKSYVTTSLGGNRLRIVALATYDGDPQFIAAAHNAMPTLLAELRELREQLPYGMKHCKIVFKECSKGHGWLTATNWVQHDCPTCDLAASQTENKLLREMLTDSIPDLKFTFSAASHWTDADIDADIERRLKERHGS